MWQRFGIIAHVGPGIAIYAFVDIENRTRVCAGVGSYPVFNGICTATKKYLKVFTTAIMMAVVNTFRYFLVAVQIPLNTG